MDSLLPNVGCELFYSKDYELAIAVMLSAQTTDKKVNETMHILFNKYPTLNDLANADEKDVFNIIKHLGLAATKSKNVIGIAKTLINKFNGNLPSDKEKLMTLPGIGNKSAGVIRAEVFKIPDLPVDTHILRLAKRFGFTEEKDDPLATELKLKKLFPKQSWIKLHHQFIHFGRYYCLARNPKCDQCQIKDLCNKK